MARIGLLLLVIIVSGCSSMQRSLDQEVDLQPNNTQNPSVLSCKRYFDGCNICVEHQGIVSCTKKACEKQEEPKCLDGEKMSED